MVALNGMKEMSEDVDRELTNLQENMSGHCTRLARVTSYSWIN